MKILVMMLSTNLAGTERALLETMRLLRLQGHEVQVLSLLPFGALKPILDAEGYVSFDIPNRGYLGWKTFFVVRRMIKTLKPDAVILGGLDADAMLAMRFSAVRFRVLINHQSHEVRSTLYWLVSYQLARWCLLDRFFFCSHFLQHEAERIIGRSEPFFDMLPNVVEPKSITTLEQKHQARERLGIPLDAMLVGGAGRLMRVKRFDVFLEVAAAVAQQDPRARFIIAGGGVEADSLKQLADSLGIAHRVHWLGWVPHMQDFYASIDVMLFTSDIDAFGLSAVEPMAYGVPVVASVVVGELRQVISDDSIGTCLDSHDVPRLAAQVLAYRGESGRIVGAAGRERIAKLCGAGIHLQKLDAVWAGRRAAP